ncbi:hypothetical protein DYU05_18555 [Mucilaginibacter terrenus]|uniref:Uncharacterized protein n=1 Tax=Mucilaginibacter terrenus TaxID=2482727 RepID=A0A3E2NLE1_9SPHI|nr:hypothetical protein [Mucilaginibacter terrenus]RFZ81824.1 hypothetical protein DYU05_18555 [Mucilaginibacter terrenus]
MEIPFTHDLTSLNSGIKWCTIISIIGGLLAVFSSIGLFYFGDQKDNLNNFASASRTLESSFVDKKLLKLELARCQATPIQIVSIGADLESERFGDELINLFTSAGWKIVPRGRLMIDGVPPKDISIIKSAGKFTFEEAVLIEVFRYLNYPVHVINERHNPLRKPIDPAKIVLELGLKY